MINLVLSKLVAAFHLPLGIDNTGSILVAILGGTITVWFVNYHVTDPLRRIVWHTKKLAEIKPEDWLDSEVWKGKVPLLPIIAMMANAYESDIQNCLEAGMNAHIAKPLDVYKMYQAIASYM